MGDELKIVRSEQFGEIRIQVIDGEPWFVGKDVAGVLGYSDTARAVRMHVDDDEKGVVKMSTPGGTQSVIVINEYGLYGLILSSKLPSAIEFKRWITHEVIPSIRKHGAYLTEPVLKQVTENPDMIFLLAERLLEEKRKHEETGKLLMDARPKAAYFDAFVNPGDSTCIRNCGKELGIPQNIFIRFMLEHKYLYRGQDGTLLPSANSINRGYFVLRDFYLKNGQMKQQTLMTCKGKEHFRQIMKRKMR